MMKSLSPMKKAGTLLAALLGGLVSLDADAAGEPLPRERVSGVASYVSGGVSLAQSKTFEQAFRDFPLVIKLYEHEGPQEVYAAEAHVQIVDADGATIVDTQTTGPFMLVRLPHGDYTVTASLDGQTLPAHRVHVTDHGHATSTFVFPAHAA